MKPTLSSFFQTYPLEGSMEVALKMVKHKLHCAIESLEKEDSEEEYMKYLSDAFRMMEAIFNEMGKHPSNY